MIQLTYLSASVWALLARNAWLEPGDVGPVYFVYILASRKNGTLYIGVTHSLRKRVWQHRHGVQSQFAHRYGVTMLVYFEEFRSVENAISREKQLKAGSRRRKIELIETANPEWADLSSGWYDGDEDIGADDES